MTKLIMSSAALVILSSALVVGIVSAQPTCGRNVGGAVCPGVRCCSIWGYCGDSEPYCGGTCESKCWSGERSDHRCGPQVGNPPCGRDRCCSVHGWCGGGGDYCGPSSCQYRCSAGRAQLARRAAGSSPGNRTLGGVLVDEALFDEMFGHREDCPSRGFYTYHAFLTAAESFPGFGTGGDVATRKREVAAFLALISQATEGKRSDVDDPHGWGLCHINTTATENDFCTSSDWPCAHGKKYSPRGAIQLAHNFNYGLAGQALGLDLVKNPELVEKDPVVSFKTAIWFWMTQHDNDPSCHDIVVNADSDAARFPRNGFLGHIINRASGLGSADRTVSSPGIGYYKRYCDMLGVSYGHDLKYWFDDTPSSEFPHIQMLVA